MVPPVPIPNTAVKRTSADDTIGFAYGKVGRCQDLSEGFLFLLQEPRFHKKRGELFTKTNPVPMFGTFLFLEISEPEERRTFRRRKRSGTLIMNLSE